MMILGLVPFYDLFRAGETGADPDLFVTRRATWEVNAAIARESLEGEFQADPEGASVEYGAEFAEGVGAFLNATAVYECLVRGRRALPPLPGVQYVAAADPAFAAGGDAFTFAIAHRVGTRRASSWTAWRVGEGDAHRSIPTPSLTRSSTWPASTASARSSATSTRCRSRTACAGRA